MMLISSFHVRDRPGVRVLPNFGQLIQDARAVLHLLCSGHQVATLEDYRRHGANAIAVPGVFGIVHVCGKALIVKNGEGLGRFQPDFCGHRRQHGVVRQVPAICEVSRKDGWFKVAQGLALSESRALTMGCVKRSVSTISSRPRAE